jgi:hypothetical protein
MSKKVSKCTTSRGIPWSEVLIKDLPGMMQDGVEAAALLAAIAKDSQRTAADVVNGRITAAEANAHAAEARRVLKQVERALKGAK